MSKLKDKLKLNFYAIALIVIVLLQAITVGYFYKANDDLNNLIKRQGYLVDSPDNENVIKGAVLDASSYGNFATSSEVEEIKEDLSKEITEIAEDVDAIYWGESY